MQQKSLIDTDQTLLDILCIELRKQFEERKIIFGIQYAKFKSQPKSTNASFLFPFSQILSATV